MKEINKWYSSIAMADLLCVLALAGLVHSSAQAPTAAPQASSATFDFDRYPRTKPFKLNTLPTTMYGPPWADIVTKPSNMLACKGATSIALCYYSG